MESVRHVPLYFLPSCKHVRMCLYKTRRAAQQLFVFREMFVLSPEVGTGSCLGCGVFTRVVPQHCSSFLSQTCGQIKRCYA